MLKSAMRGLLISNLLKFANSKVPDLTASTSNSKLALALMHAGLELALDAAFCDAIIRRERECIECYE